MERLITLIVNFFVKAVSGAPRQTIPLAVEAEAFVHEYDRFKDETYVKVTFIKKSMQHDFESSEWGFSTTFDGQVPGEHVEIKLTFNGSSRFSHFGNDTMVRAIIDGERMELGELDYQSVPHRGVQLEIASMPLPLTLVSRMATAESVELKGGSSELRLGDQEKMKIAKFLDVLAPEA